MPLVEVRRRAERTNPPRDFWDAILNASASRPALIAEIKKASPSAGVIVQDFDPAAIARTYHAHGAAALSVLTDETYFQGRLEYLQAVRQAVPLPVLRKDFIIDEYQVFESRAAGADCVLLIVEVLGTKKTAAMLSLIRSLEMDVLVEVHSEANLLALLDEAGPSSRSTYLLGINNRDLAAQRTDLATTTRLAALLPPSTPFVSESGIKTREDVAIVQKAGASAILVGESLLRSPDMGASIAALLQY